ncbi:MAG: hypothetical protein COB07_08020 [Sulfurovum sp.]|nr:MAG: hypothetical protein COB07_08020 [Sulfurovum sp.]
MKTLQAELIMEELGDLAININPYFLNKEKIDVPILRQVDLLLDAVGDKGLKLTAKGNLPTKVVKEITLCCPTLSEGHYLKWTKRYLEEEQVPVMRSRLVCEVGKLLKVSKGKIVHSSMSKAYRDASQAEKFIYLVWQFTKLNLGYFDRMQEESLSSGISLIMMQMVRDKPKMFREANVYTAFLMDDFPQLLDAVEEQILPDSYFSEDPYDEFEHMVQIRLFKNFFVPFGLVEEQGVGVSEIHEYAKTDFLETFLLPHNEVNTSNILNKKELRFFKERAKKEKLNIQLFGDFCFIYAHAARYPLKPFSIIAEDLVKGKRIIGTAAKVHEAFYTDLAKATEQTLKYFTQLEVKGGGSRGEGMKNDFLSLIDGLYATLPHDKPHNMMAAMQAIPLFFLDMLSNVHKIDTTSKDFYAECRKHFSAETVEDIAAVLLTMGELEKRAKKFKRINANMETLVKEVIMTFILAVMSIYTYEMDKEIP